MPLFTLTTASYFYSKDQAEKLEKLGFKFRKFRAHGGCSGDFAKSMKSDSLEIKIDTLDELLGLAKEHGDLIISANEDQPSIEIYDNCRE